MLSKLGKYIDRLKPRYDDTAIDRLNSVVTTFILLFLSLLVASNQFFGDPIHCWLPAHFKVPSFPNL